MPTPIYPNLISTFSALWDRADRAGLAPNTLIHTLVVDDPVLWPYAEAVRALCRGDLAAMAHCSRAAQATIATRLSLGLASYAST